jgi:hypothetical protein
LRFTILFYFSSSALNHSTPSDLVLQDKVVVVDPPAKLEFEHHEPPPPPPKEVSNERYIVKATPMEHMHKQGARPAGEKAAGEATTGTEKQETGNASEVATEKDDPRDQGFHHEIERSGLHEESLDEAEVPAVPEDRDHEERAAAVKKETTVNKTEPDIPSFRWVLLSTENV